MPNYKKHLIGGLFSYVIMLYCLTKFNASLNSSIQFLFSTLIGSLFPDIDTKSKIQKLFYTTLLVIFIFLTIKHQNKLFIIFSFIGLTPLIVDHRGIFHRIWFILLIGLLSALVGTLYCPKYLSLIILNIIFFITGAISHLFLDLGPKKMLRT